MKKLIPSVLAALACAGPFAAAAAPPDVAPPVAEALKQSEYGLGNAVRNVDMVKLNQIIADDFRAVGGTGAVRTKETLLARIKGGPSKMESFEIGPMDVKVLARDVATVSGEVTEQRVAAGMETQTRVLWLDVWQKRGDRWVLVRTQTSKLP